VLVKLQPNALREKISAAFRAVANGFIDVGGPASGRQGSRAAPYLAKLLAIRTGLRLIEQLRLLDRKILDDLLRDGPADLAGSDFNASERGLHPSEVAGLQIDVKFLGNFIERLLVFR